jgi:transcription antitermination protein NusB
MTTTSTMTDARPQPRKRQRRSRTTGRLVAVQALYEMDVAGAGLDRVIDDFVRHRLTEAIDGVSYQAADRDHFEAVVRGVVREREDLDDMLSAVLSGDWTVERLEPLLRAVMRAATFELADMLDVPARVAIAEYLAVAHAFFAEREPAMVNGVLDAIARALRPEEMEAATGAERGPDADE